MKTLTISEAANFLHVSKYVMRELAAKGEVPGAKVGREWVFTDEGLETYLRELVSRQTAARRGGDTAVSTVYRRLKRAAPALHG